MLIRALRAIKVCTIVLYALSSSRDIRIYRYSAALIWRNLLPPQSRINREMAWIAYYGIGSTLAGGRDIRDSRRRAV